MQYMKLYESFHKYVMCIYGIIKGDEGGLFVTKLTLESPAFKRVSKNLSLENFHIDKSLALQALDVINSKKTLTPTMIREALNAKV